MKSFKSFAKKIPIVFGSIRNAKRDLSEDWFDKGRPIESLKPEEHAAIKANTVAAVAPHALKEIPMASAYEDEDEYEDDEEEEEDY